MSQHTVQEPVGAYCRHVPAYSSRTSWGPLYICPNICLKTTHNHSQNNQSSGDSNPEPPECHQIHHNVLPLNQTPTVQQPLSTAIQGTANINIFSSQNRSVLQQDRQHAWGHNWHMALLQHIPSKWPKCFMSSEVQAAKQWLLFSWPNIQTQGSFTQQCSTLMRGTYWCMHATWVADGTCNWLQHYSLEAMDNPPNRPYLVPREFHLEKHVAGKQFATDSNLKHHCHFLASDTWHQFHLHQHKNFGESDIQRSVHRDIHRVRKRLYPFFIFFSRCPVCGEWCKLHWLLLDTPSFDW